jgi:uncharacterized protein (DUF4415 family)
VGGDRTDWERVRAMTDEEVEDAALSDPDAQPTDAEFWKDARLVIPMALVDSFLQVDPDVLEWFKSQGEGYKARMNAALRAYMEVNKQALSSRKPRKYPK